MNYKKVPNFFAMTRIIVFALLNIAFQISMAQIEPQDYCGTPACGRNRAAKILTNRTAQAQSLNVTSGPQWMTARDTLNVLVVFVQFPDDNYLPNSPYWPKGQAPTYMNATVDQTWSTTPNLGSFTDYFNQMSFNTLRITGTSVSVVTPHARQFYLDNGWPSTDIYKEVLRQLDATMDFAQFDHWRYNYPTEYSQNKYARWNC